MFVGRVGAHDLFKTSLLLQKFKCEEMAIFRRLRESTPKLQLLTLRREYGVVPRGCVTTPCQGVQSPWLLFFFFFFFLSVLAALLLEANSKSGNI